MSNKFLFLADSNCDQSLGYKNSENTAKLAQLANRPWVMGHASGNCRIERHLWQKVEP